MARIPNPKTDFTVDVEGVGKFTFGRRKMADEIAIQREYARILDGVVPTDWLHLVANWKSTLKVLMVSGPENWGKDIFGVPTSDIDEMDPQDASVYATLTRVHLALIEKERSFRPGAAQAGQDEGQGAGGVT